MRRRTAKRNRRSKAPAALPPRSASIRANSSASSWRRRRPFTIFVNALFLQQGPHPSPIFAARPLLHREEAASAPRIQARAAQCRRRPGARRARQLIADIQRELTRHGFYDGPADGIWGAKTDAAAREFVQAAGLKINPEASEALLRAITASNAKPASRRRGAGAATIRSPN